jgi:hypothetical protein
MSATRPTLTPARRRARLFGVIGVVAATGAALAAQSAIEGTAAAWCSPAGVLRADTLPGTVSPADCDLRGREIASGSARLTVPAPGSGISALEGKADGGESTLILLTAPDGSVTITHQTPEDHETPANHAGGPAGGGAATATSAAATTAACRDGSYTTMGYKFTGRFDWYLNSSGTPGYLRSSALSTIATATADVARGSNKCGLARKPKLSQRYAGGTSRRPQITAAGSCTSRGDGVSVTGWMKLPRVLAYTCSYYKWNGRSWVVSESDMAMSTAFSWFTGRIPSGCTYTFDLRGVVVHERGHTFGLGHVDSHAHGSLTMSPYSAPCTTANRALGYGDYRGLSLMYGVS